MADGVNQDWRGGVTSLADMIRHRADFLRAPGSAVDHEEAASLLGPGYGDLDDAALEGALFDHVAGLFAGGGPITLHRHITVEDFGTYVAALEEGSATTGGHWSLSPDIESPADEQEAVPLRMTALVGHDQVCWPSTFQAWFSHPWEREVFVTGTVSLVEVVNLETGDAYDPLGESYPAFRP